MIELFCRSDFKLKDAKGITPIYIDDEVSSLSAILLNDDYYKALLDGKEVVIPEFNFVTGHKEYKTRIYHSF